MSSNSPHSQRDRNRQQHVEGLGEFSVRFRDVVHSFSIVPQDESTLTPLLQFLDRTQFPYIRIVSPFSLTMKGDKYIKS